MKRCSKCGEVKSLDGFHKSAGNSDGVNGHCKACVKARTQERKRLFACIDRTGQVKTCRECGETKAASEFFANARNADGLFHHCKKCNQRLVRKYLSERPEKTKQYSKKRMEKPENREYARSRQSQYAKSESGKVKRAQQARRQRESLCDHYIKTMLVQGTSLKRTDIPEELVRAKRDYMGLKRASKELKQQLIGVKS